MNRFEFVQIDENQFNNDEQEMATEKTQQQMPNLLEGYDCGDEPEEEDDSVNDQNDDDESGESENDDIS